MRALMRRSGPIFLPLGILSGASSLVPYAGPLVLGVTITLFALVTGGVLKALAAAIYFVVYGQLEGNVLAPFIYCRTGCTAPAPVSEWLFQSPGGAAGGDDCPQDVIIPKT